MIFYSHSTKENDTIIGTKEIKEHLNQVENLAIDSLRNTGFSNLYISNIENVIKYTCLFHDIGKYTTYFQDYLLKENDTGALRYHSDISAIFAFNYLKNSNIFNNDQRNYFPFWVYYLIKHHHSNLKSLKGLNLVGNNPTIFKKNYQSKKDNLITNIDLILSEFSINGFSNNDFSTFLKLPPEKDIINRANWLKGREKNIENYFYILYCFSLLIESDKLNASNTETHIPQIIPIENLYKYLEDKNKEIKKINSDRNEVRELICSEDNINKIIKHKGIYTLTAPTGIGKTLTSLNLALKLKNKLDETNKQNTQIIYCLPFINIIEQISKEFETLFPDIKILKHHQYSDIFSKKEENEKNNSIDNKLMELECWQGDLIITTFVQFLHTIIGNKNKLLKKFHHLSNSIIILDEIQAINIEYWPLIGAVLHYLVKFLNCKIILMTATKPLIIESTKKYLLENETDITESELLSEHSKYFDKLKRTQIVPLLENDINEVSDFIEIFKNYRNNNQSALIVLNTINSSIEIFKELQNIIPKEKLFYLSTNIIPAQRKIIINNVKNKLLNNENPVLVSTQCIEAGVDIDFDIGFRDIGPLDSIIQVAGRINRNNNPEKAFSPLYVFKFKNDSKIIYGKIIINLTYSLLKEEETIIESHYLNLINKYFEKIIGNSDDIPLKSFEKSQKLFKAMTELNFTSDDPDEITVDSFKAIENKHNYVNLFIEKDCKAAYIRKFYEEKYLKENNIKQKRINYLKIKRLFNNFILSVPQNKLFELENSLLDEKKEIYLLPKEKLENFYNKKTGFCRDITKPEDLIF